MSQRTGRMPSRRRIVVTAGGAGLLAAFPRLASAESKPPAAAAAPGTTAEPGSAGDFTPFLHQDFIAWKGEVRTTLRLVDIQHFARGRRPAGFRRPFSLLFRGWRNSGLASGEYHVRFPNGSGMVMFVTPVGMQGTLFEVPFN